MKNKTSKFKNPFELMEEEDEENSRFSSSTYVEYQRAEQTSQNPLPFNPYEISPTQPNVISQPRTEPTAFNPSNISSPEHPSQAPSNGFNPYEQQPQISPPKFETNKPYEPDIPSEVNDDGDPPLLEDLGIQPDKIKYRILSVVKLSKPDQQMMGDPDLSGPIFIALCFGILLLLSGKIHFGDIYAIFIFGNTLLYVFFNFMSQSEVIPFYNIMSTMGYGLIPMLLLGFMGIFIPLKGMTGIIFGLALAAWSSIAAGNIIEALMKEHDKSRKVLIVYPLFLFYVSFAMIVMF